MRYVVDVWIVSMECRLMGTSLKMEAEIWGLITVEDLGFEIVN